MLGGVLVKDYYLDLVDGIADAEDLGKDNNESDIEGFEQDLQSLLQVFSTTLLLPGVGVLPYMGHIGVCRCEEYGFQAVYSSKGYIYKSERLGLE